MECGGGGSEEARVDFCVLAHIEALRWREGKLSLLVSVSIVRLDDVGGIEDGPLRDLLIIASLSRRGIVEVIASLLLLPLRVGVLCLLWSTFLEVLQSMSHI